MTDRQWGIVICSLEYTEQQWRAVADRGTPAVCRARMKRATEIRKIRMAIKEQRRKTKAERDRTMDQIADKEFRRVD